MSEHELPDHLTQLTPAAKLLGREIVSIDGETGTTTSRFIAPAEFGNRHGGVHGGMLAAMLDSAAASALFAGLPAHLTAVTMRLDTRFHRPAVLGHIVGVGRVMRHDERNAEVEAELRDEAGTLVASVRAEFRIRPRR